MLWIRGPRYSLTTGNGTHKKEHGCIWGYPIGLETVTLIYNKNLLVGPPPADLAQLVSISQQIKTRNPGVIPILWEYKTAYYSWGILASAGAYVFAKTGTGYNLQNAGIANPRAMEGLSEIIALVKAGVLPKSVSYIVTEELMTPRHINAPADYWPQKVLAVSSANAAMQNYVSIHEHQTRPNPALAAVHGQAALLLRYDVPAYYVSRELLAAALRTELPDDMVFEAIPFPFDALVFMLPKGTLRHPTEGDCPFLVLSRTSKGQTLSLPIPELDFKVTTEQDAVLVTTYMPEASLNVTYFKSVPLIPGTTIKQAFQQASSVPFSLIVNDELADNEEGVDLSAEHFIDKLWLLAVTLLLIMVSSEELVERTAGLRMFRVRQRSISTKSIHTLRMEQMKEAMTPAAIQYAPA
ncbi:MAG: hypothetical protein WB586_28830 [Chthoniobacterales bacterium]